MSTGVCVCVCVCVNAYFIIVPNLWVGVVLYVCVQQKGSTDRHSKFKFFLLVLLLSFDFRESYHLLTHSMVQSPS